MPVRRYFLCLVAPYLQYKKLIANSIYSSFLLLNNALNCSFIINTNAANYAREITHKEPTVFIQALGR